MSMPEPGAARRVSYRRRRPLPAIALIAVLGVVAAVVWIRTIDSAEKRDDIACGTPSPVVATTTVDPAAPPPDPAAPAPQPPTLGQVQPATALDAVDPVPPDAVKVRVLNGSGQRGRATLVDTILVDDLGFTQSAPPSDDPMYPEPNHLQCEAQIRYGPLGAGAGRTLSFAVPCAELVLDQRQDDTVDLAIGTRFEALLPSAEAKDALRQLAELAAAPPPADAGGQQAAPATVDPALLSLIRANARCGS